MRGGYSHLGAKPKLGRAPHLSFFVKFENKTSSFYKLKTHFILMLKQHVYYSLLLGHSCLLSVQSRACTFPFPHIKKKKPIANSVFEMPVIGAGAGEAGLTNYAQTVCGSCTCAAVLGCLIDSISDFRGTLNSFCGTPPTFL